MALAVVVTLEKEIPELATYIKGKTGKALGRELDRLDSTARRKSVSQPSSLLSESQAALIQQMKDEGFDPSKMRLPPEQWFLPADGLKTVRAIAEYVAANLNDFKQPHPILRDLKAAETLLVAADAAGVKFHFAKVDL
jgi:hypothetical protein